MMGDYHTRAYFKPCLNYCLTDKQTQDGQVLYKDRSEIIYYHQCHGSIEELNRQFKEVAALNRQISEPVLTITLSFPPEERLAKSQLAQLAKECAKGMDFEDHQYVAIYHKDTPQQHVHIIANRVGFDRHITSDSFSHYRMAKHCREAELRHGLIQELGPYSLRTEEQRLVPRQGLRLDKLKENIRQALLQSHDLPEFKSLMQKEGYTVYTRKGIAFMDDKHIVFRGYEVGYPYHKIQSTLARDLSVRQKEDQRQRQEEALRQQEEERLRQRQTQGHHQEHKLKISL